MMELRIVNVGYGKTQIISEVNVRFHQGELCCIIGKNGSGKSTLLRAMAGLLPYSGSIGCGGAEIRALSRIARAQRISYMPQMLPTPQIDVETLVAHGRFPHMGFGKRLTAHDQERIQYALQVAGLEALRAREVCTLSGGERQRAYIALAVAQDADMIFLDEPTAHLDVEHQLEVLALLLRLRGEGKGIALVMHDLPQAFHYADKIALVANGTLPLQGSPKEICEDSLLQDALGVRMGPSSDARELYAYRMLKGGMV